MNGKQVCKLLLLLFYKRKIEVLVQNLRGDCIRDNGLIKIISIFICSVPGSCGGSVVQHLLHDLVSLL